MQFSACLVCRHARKPKGSGLGRFQCAPSGEFVECTHVCTGYESLFSAAEKIALADEPAAASPHHVQVKSGVECQFVTDD